MGVDSALLEIDEIRRDIDAAAEALLTQAETGLTLTASASPDLAAVRSVFHAILEACSFQDLAGQRLSRLRSTLNGEIEQRPDAHLLEGPAAKGVAPDQAAIDELFLDAGSVQRS